MAMFSQYQQEANLQHYHNVPLILSWGTILLVDPNHKKNSIIVDEILSCGINIMQFSKAADLHHGSVQLLLLNWK